MTNGLGDGFSGGGTPAGGSVGGGSVGGGCVGGGARPATGRQFLLRDGAARAQVGEVAAVLREFSVDGVHYTETWPDRRTPPMGCGLILMPWPNRVAGGRWSYRGEAQQLDLTEPGRGNAIHGLLRHAVYEAVEAGESFVTLAASIYPQHGWPFTLDTSVRYEVAGGGAGAAGGGGGSAGLTVTHQVTNVGPEECVFGCGAHPYLRVGETPVGDLTVSVQARSQLVTDEAMIPVRTEQLSDDLAALRSGARVADLDLDTGFTDLDLAPTGRLEHRVEAPGGRGVVLWADPVFAWAQVFTPRVFPGEAGPRQALAIEPMTCPADALNSGSGLIRLAPGESWSGSWGLQPF